MIITNLRELKRLKAARERPILPYNDLLLSETFERIKNYYFNDISAFITYYFVMHGPLACISIGTSEATIYIHNLLNHPETPIEVMSLVFTHEILHVKVKPRIIDGHEKQHPPEFWEQEKIIAPEREKAWHWIWGNYLTCLIPRPRLERIDVLPEWKEVWGFPKKSFIDCENLFSDKVPDEPESIGW